MRNGNVGNITAIAMAATIALGAANVAVASPGEAHGSGEYSAVLAAKASLGQAIAAAEKRTGARAVKAEMERHKGTYRYEVRVLTEDRAIEVRVDPGSGQVTGTENQGLLERLFNWEDTTEFRKIAASPVTLAAAIAAAEREVGGKAIEASIEEGDEDEDGKMLFEVRVAKDKTLRKVKIDSANGKVVKVTVAGEGEKDKD